MASNKIKIIIVDDHPIFRAGVKALLQIENDFTVIGEVEDGLNAYNFIVNARPDLVLMDLSMPHVNGTDVIARVKQSLPDIYILALTVHKEEEYVRASFVGGADGYILKDDTYEELVLAIRSVSKGMTYISPSVSGHLVAKYIHSGRRTAVEPSWDFLTSREREVMRLVVNGLKNREIAESLSLSIKTIEKHRSNLMRKLNLKNTPALIAYAIENGLVK